MSLTSNSDSVARSPERLRPALREDAVSAINAIVSRKAPTSRIRKPTVIDARISALKILALSLLRQVETLENQSAVETLPEWDLQLEVRRFEAELIRNALIRTGGRQRRAAHLLGMKVTTLNTKIRRYHIEFDEPPIVTVSDGDPSWDERRNPS
jgi:transcriptional regulator with GAF, ATPase, and Fis domain